MKKFVHPTVMVTPATLILFTLAMVGPAHAAGSISNAHFQSTVGPLGSLTPPVAALQATGVPGSGIHALGFVANSAVPRAALLLSVAPSASLPASVDLSQYDPPVGDQGGLESCTSWATGYYLRGWYAKRDGYYPPGGAGGTGSFAPMYIYSQLVHGQNVGTSFASNLGILRQQGIDTRADYSQGDYNNSDLPTAGETYGAGRVKLASYNDVSGPNLQNWIETTLASGNPVAIGIPVYPEFDHASAANPLVGLPQPGETSRGGHAVFASKYDANGLWIENSWGTTYGLNGWAELSWSFVNQYANEAISEAPLSPGGQVPNVRGETPTVAGATVRAAGFTVAITSAADSTCNNIGLVMREIPGPGSWAVFGSPITLTVGTRPRTPCP
jgi:hypothetical protein